jgi:hypothetical protein
VGISRWREGFDELSAKARSRLRRGGREVGYALTMASRRWRLGQGVDRVRGVLGRGFDKVAWRARVWNEKHMAPHSGRGKERMREVVERTGRSITKTTERVDRAMRPVMRAADRQTQAVDRASDQATAAVRAGLRRRFREPMRAWMRSSTGKKAATLAELWKTSVWPRYSLLALVGVMLLLLLGRMARKEPPPAATQAEIEMVRGFVKGPGK